MHILLNYFLGKFLTTGMDAAQRETKVIKVTMAVQSLKTKRIPKQFVGKVKSLERPKA